jgi:WD40 repeat protein
MIIRSLAVSPANDMLAAGGQDGYITVWDIKTGAEKFHVCGYIDPDGAGNCKSTGYNYVDTDIRGVAFSADGRLLVSGSSDHSVWLWDAHTGDLLARSAEGNEGGHINTVASVAFNPKTDQIASVSWDNTVRLWQPIHKNNKWELKRVDTLAGHSNSIWATAYSPDGKWLATGASDKTVILWKVNQPNQIGTPIAKMDGEIWALAVSADGKQFSAGDITGNIRVWDVNGSALKSSRTLIHTGGVLALAYSHDNKWLASSGYEDNTIRVWDAKTGEEVWHIENAHASEIWALMFSPDDRWIASASFDKTVKLWDTTTHKQVGNSMQHDEGVYSLIFNHDGTKLLVAGFPFDIFIWDLMNPAANSSPSLLKGHSSYINFLAQDPKYPGIFASTSDDKTLLIWNMDLKEHAPQVLGLNESMEAVTFRPNGDWLASATNNNTVLLWQLDAQRCSENWDKDTCKPEMIGTPLVGHKTAVINVIFLSDTVMISSSEDGQLIQWDLDKNHWYQHACSLVNRTFSTAEHSQYIEGKINVTMLKVVSWFSNLFGSDTQQAIPPCINSDSTGG